MSTPRQLARRAASTLVAEFLATQIPVDHDAADPDVCFGHISDLDVAFIEFWQMKDQEHGLSCSDRTVHKSCTKCDALQTLRPGPFDGVSTLLHERLLQIGTYDPFGKMTLPVGLMRSSMAV